MTSGPPHVAALSVTGSVDVAGAPVGDGALDRDVGSWQILFSNSGSGCQALREHPCRAHCSLRGRGVPSA
jgi:hypothetical protein